MHIRRAVGGDVHEICDIWRLGVPNAFGIPAPANDVAVRFYRKRVKQQKDGFGVWVVEVNGVIAGWTSLQPCRANPISRMAEFSVYVSPEHRTNGLGQKLLIYVHAKAKLSRFSHLVAFLRTDNRAILELLTSLGWKRVGVIPAMKTDKSELAYFAYCVR